MDTEVLDSIDCKKCEWWDDFIGKCTAEEPTCDVLMPRQERAIDDYIYI